MTDSAKRKVAIRDPCFAIRELSSAVGRVTPSGCGFFVHVLSTVLVNNTLNEITIKGIEIQGKMKVYSRGSKVKRVKRM
jgi:hypothetical protein